jgi:hypothetical protein
MLEAVYVSVPIHDAITLSRYLVSIDGSVLAMGFIGLLQTVNPINYSAIANSHILQFTTARTKCSHSDASSPVVTW